MKVYLLQYEEIKDEYDIQMDVAIYSSTKKAQRAAEKFKNKTPFKDRLGVFTVAEYTINKKEWSEGFFEYTT